jgi:hypothetical protein
MLQVMGRESDVIPVIMCLATASNKVLTREHIGHAGSIWVISGVWEPISSTSKPTFWNSQLLLTNWGHNSQNIPYPLTADCRSAITTADAI